MNQATINKHSMATYASFQIQDYASMVEWIKRQFGYPLIQVELTDDQIQSCINDAVEVYTEYVTYDEKYLGMDLTTYVEGEGITLPDNVIGIFALDDENVAGGVNTLFTVPNQMQNAGIWPYASGNRNGQGWVDFEFALQNVKMAKLMTGGGYQWNFNERTKVLQLDPDPGTQGVTEGSVVCGCYIVRTEDQVYGERLCKRLALAYCKKILGKVRGTFQNVPLLAGANVNETVGEEGKEEEEALMEELRNMMPPAFIVGG
jgi:hypothetical protein